jgi:hypothetical protein
LKTPEYPLMAVLEDRMELTAQTLLDAYDLVFPPMYYAWHERVETGKVLIMPASDISPEFFVFHSQEDAAKIARESKCRLIHIRDFHKRHE